MKTIILILTLAFSTLSIAQRPNKERIRALKIAYITEKLDLSAKEAQAFWPIYNVYNAQMEEIHTKERKLLRNLKDNWEGISEEKAQEGVRVLLDTQQDRYNSKETLINQLRTVVSYKKTLLLMKAEEDFKRDLIRKLKDRRGGRSDNRSNDER